MLAFVVLRLRRPTGWQGWPMASFPSVMVIVMTTIDLVQGTVHPRSSLAGLILGIVLLPLTLYRWRQYLDGTRPPPPPPFWRDTSR
jgi:hypothetical protein